MSAGKRFGVGIAGLVAALAGVTAMAITAFACSPLPSVDLNTSSGLPGSQVLLTGERWAPGVPVFIHWDTLTGPLLAQAMPTSAIEGPNLGPVVVQIPAPAAPGYHTLVATDNSQSSSYGRVPIQVLNPDGTTARLPQAVLGTGTARTTPSPNGVLVLGLLAALGLSGLTLSTVSVVSLVGERRRVTVPTSTGPAHRR